MQQPVEGAAGRRLGARLHRGAGPRAALALAMGLWAAPAWGHINAPLSILAGSGVAGSLDGPGGQARFSSPTALALDAAGKTLWVLDQGGASLRRVALTTDRSVSTLVLDEPARKLAADCTELVFLPWDQSLALLCRQGRRIVELDGLSGAARARTIYSGRALAQLTVAGRGRTLWALELDGGRLMAAEDKPPHPLRFSDAQQGAGFTAVAGDGDSLLAYRPGASPAIFTYLPGTSTAVGLSASAVSNLADLPNHGPLRMAHAAFDDGETRTYFWEPGGTNLYRVEGGQLLPLEVPNAEGVNLNNGNRMPFNRLAGFVVDAAHRRIHFSDAPNNRVLQLQDQDYNLGGFGQGSRWMGNDFAYSMAKPEGVRRILFYGGSYAYYTTSGTGKFYNLNKRLEYYLNLKSLAASDPYGYQVLFDGEPLQGAGYSGDVLSIATTKVATRGAWQADDYAVALSPLDLFFCGLSYLNRPLDEHGVPTERFDPEYVLEAPTDRYKGLAADLYQEIAGHAADFAPGLTMDDKGHLLYDPGVADLYRHFGANRFTSLLEACTNGLLGALAAQVQKLSPGAKLFVILGPQRNFLGFQETVPNMRFHKMDTVADYNWSGFQALNTDPNIIEINVDDPIKAESVSYFPLFYTNDHMDQGTDIAGYLAAELLWPHLSQVAKAGR